MRKLAIVLAVTAFSGAAWGQAGEFWFNYGYSMYQNNGLGTIAAFTNTNDVKLDNGYRFGFRFDFNIGDHLGAEVGYAFNHTNLDFTGASANAITGSSNSPDQKFGMHMHQVAFNGMYYPFTSDKAKARPFLTAGFGFNNFVPPGGQSFQGSTKIMANFGAGVKVHIHGMFAGRLDVREYISPQPNFGFFGGGGGLWQTEVSAGVGVGF